MKWNSLDMLPPPANVEKPENSVPVVLLIEGGTIVSPAVYVYSSKNKPGEWQHCIRDFTFTFHRSRVIAWALAQDFIGDYCSKE